MNAMAVDGAAIARLPSIPVAVKPAMRNIHASSPFYLFLIARIRTIRTQRENYNQCPSGIDCHLGISILIYDASMRENYSLSNIFFIFMSFFD
jgi:hypothetical protein